jgi:hypothetical protein
MAEEKSAENPEDSSSEDKNPARIKAILAVGIILVLLSLFFYGRVTQSKLEKQVVAQQDTIVLLSGEIKKLQAEIQATKIAMAANLKLAQKAVDAAQKRRGSPSKVPVGKPVKKK